MGNAAFLTKRLRDTETVRGRQEQYPSRNYLLLDN